MQIMQTYGFFYANCRITRLILAKKSFRQLLELGIIMAVPIGTLGQHFDNSIFHLTLKKSYLWETKDIPPV